MTREDQNFVVQKISKGGLGIGHLLDKFLALQSWLGQNLPDFLFIYVPFNIPLSRSTDLEGNVSHEWTN